MQLVSTSTLLLATFLIFSSVKDSNQLKCYACAGYNSNKPDNSTTNTAKCKDGSFDSGAIMTMETPTQGDSFCYKAVLSSPQVSFSPFTVRYGGSTNSSTAEAISKRFLEGRAEGSWTLDMDITVCNQELCNSSSLSSVFVPLILVAALIALKM